jgi:hypothetical protein
MMNCVFKDNSISDGFNQNRISSNWSNHSNRTLGQLSKMQPKLTAVIAPRAELHRENSTRKT